MLAIRWAPDALSGAFRSSSTNSPTRCCYVCLRRVLARMCVTRLLRFERASQKRWEAREYLGT